MQQFNRENKLKAFQSSRKVHQNQNRSEFVQFIRYEDKINCEVLKVFRRRAADIKSFHQIISPIIIVGNFFSIFPIFGTCFKSFERVLFRIYNPIAIYSLVIQSLLFIEMGLLACMVVLRGFTLFFAGKLCNASIGNVIVNVTN